MIADMKKMKNRNLDRLTLSITEAYAVFGLQNYI